MTYKRPRQHHRIGRQIGNDIQHLKMSGDESQPI